MKLTSNHLLFIFIILLICFSTYVLIIYNVNSCTRDPFNYGLNQYRQIYDADLIYGYVYVTNFFNHPVTPVKIFGDINTSKK